MEVKTWRNLAGKLNEFNIQLMMDRSNEDELLEIFKFIKHDVFNGQPSSPSTTQLLIPTFCAIHEFVVMQRALRQYNIPNGFLELPPRSVLKYFVVLFFKAAFASHATPNFEHWHHKNRVFELLQSGNAMLSSKKLYDKWAVGRFVNSVNDAIVALPIFKFDAKRGGIMKTLAMIENPWLGGDCGRVWMLMNDAQHEIRMRSSGGVTAIAKQQLWNMVRAIQVPWGRRPSIDVTSMALQSDLKPTSPSFQLRPDSQEFVPLSRGDSPATSNSSGRTTPKEDMALQKWICDLCQNCNAVNIDSCMVCNTPRYEILVTEHQPALYVPTVHEAAPAEYESVCPDIEYPISKPVQLSNCPVRAFIPVQAAESNGAPVVQYVKTKKGANRLRKLEKKAAITIQKWWRALNPQPLDVEKPEPTQKQKQMTKKQTKEFLKRFKRKFHATKIQTWWRALPESSRQAFLENIEATHLPTEVFTSMSEEELVQYILENNKSASASPQSILETYTRETLIKLADAVSKVNPRPTGQKVSREGGKKKKKQGRRNTTAQKLDQDLIPLPKPLPKIPSPELKPVVCLEESKLFKNLINQFFKWLCFGASKPFPKKKAEIKRIHSRIVIQWDKPLAKVADAWDELRNHETCQLDHCVVDFDFILTHPSIQGQSWADVYFFISSNMKRLMLPYQDQHYITAAPPRNIRNLLLILDHIPLYEYEHTGIKVISNDYKYICDLLTSKDKYSSELIMTQQQRKKKILLEHEQSSRAMVEHIDSLTGPAREAALQDALRTQEMERQSILNQREELLDKLMDKKKLSQLQVKHYKNEAFDDLSIEDLKFALLGEDDGDDPPQQTTDPKLAKATADLASIERELEITRAELHAEQQTVFKKEQQIELAERMQNLDRMEKELDLARTNLQKQLALEAQEKHGKEAEQYLDAQILEAKEEMERVSQDLKDEHTKQIFLKKSLHQVASQQAAQTHLDKQLAELAQAKEQKAKLIEKNTQLEQGNAELQKILDASATKNSKSKRKRNRKKKNQCQERNILWNSFIKSLYRWLGTDISTWKLPKAFIRWKHAWGMVNERFQVFKQHNASCKMCQNKQPALDTSLVLNHEHIVDKSWHGVFQFIMVNVDKLTESLFEPENYDTIYDDVSYEDGLKEFEAMFHDIYAWLLEENYQHPFWQEQIQAANCKQSETFEAVHVEGVLGRTKGYIYSFLMFFMMFSIFFIKK